jgi:hypothetical protein
MPGYIFNLYCKEILMDRDEEAKKSGVFFYIYSVDGNDQFPFLSHSPYALHFVVK